MADWIPGLNVGNIIKQGKSFFGAAPVGDYDIFDNVTISGRSGQTSLAPGDNFLKDIPARPVDNQTPQDPGSPEVTQNQIYAQQAAQARATAQNNARRNAGVKQAGFESEGRTLANGSRQQYNNDAQDLVTGLRTGQNTINSGRVNNALNLRRSMAGIASGVRQGIRSGAVNLANINAMDSGATEAMSRAFARQGNSQAGQVNNEAQLKENELTSTQQNLDIQKNQGLGRLKGWRDNKVNEISSKLWQNLQELDASAQAEGVGGVVDMGIRDRVVTEASRALDEVDAVTQRELSSIGGLDAGTVQAQASQMDAAGALATNPFAVEASTVQFGQPEGNALPGAPLGPFGSTPRTRDENGNLIALAPTTEDEVRA